MPSDLLTAPSSADDLLLAEEAVFRLQYGDVTAGLSRMYDVFQIRHAAGPRVLELVPVLYREYIAAVACTERYGSTAHSPTTCSILFHGVPVIRGSRCLAT